MRAISGGCAAAVLLWTIAAASGEEVQKQSFWSQWAAPEVHGFWEARGGYRLQNDRYQKDMSVMETRFQLDLFTYTDRAEFKYNGDV